MRKQSILIYTIIFLIITGCDNDKPEKNNSFANKKNIKPEYAECFEISITKNYKKITVNKPWKDAGFSKSYFILKDSVEEYLPKDAIVFNNKINKIACLSSTHLAMVSRLDALEKLKAISDVDNTHNQAIIKGVKNGHIKEIGSYNHINKEKIVEIGPDLIFESATGSSYDHYKSLNNLGLKVAFVASYMEKHPLAKLEWLKYFGAFLNKTEKADSIFKKIKNQYNRLKKKTINIKNKPLVLVGYAKKGDWIAPGGNSYFAQFLKDAGARYVWKDDTTSGNIHISFENAFQKGLKADFWVNTQLSHVNLNNPKAYDKRYAEFKPVKKENVFNNDRRLNEHNRNDYWEKGTVEPHIILKDLIKIFHPELLPDHQFKYYRQLHLSSS